MIPTDVLRIISLYTEEICVSIRPELRGFRNVGVLANPHAIDLIDTLLEKRSITLEMAEWLVQNPDPRYLERCVNAYPEVVTQLCKHHSTEAIDIVKRYEAYDWEALNSNPYAIELLSNHPERIQYHLLSDNPGAYGLLFFLLTSGKVCELEYYHILNGVHADKLLAEYPFSPRHRVLQEVSITEEQQILEKVRAGLEDYEVQILCACPFESVLRLIYERYLPDIDPEVISRNPVAIDLLLEESSLISWDALARNPSERVMEVVIHYRYSFLASVTSNRRMYSRRDAIDVDENRYRQKIEDKVTILSQM